uniref:Uncharacterized protein n=1 Tax=Opuntia streptacantha TaxID=393608 RepID=A0A7C8ZHY0_OPUST
MQAPTDEAVRSARRLVQVKMALDDRVGACNQMVDQLMQDRQQQDEQILQVAAPALGIQTENMLALGTLCERHSELNGRLLRLQNEQQAFQRTIGDIRVAMEASRFLTVGSPDEAAVVTDLWINRGWRGLAYVCHNNHTADTTQALQGPNAPGVPVQELEDDHPANQG